MAVAPIVDHRLVETQSTSPADLLEKGSTMLSLDTARLLNNENETTFYSRFRQLTNPPTEQWMPPVTNPKIRLSSFNPVDGMFLF